VEEINRQEQRHYEMPTIPMGVDTQLFHPTKQTDQVRASLDASQGPLLLAVGRLSPEKGHRYLISAMPHVLKRFPTAKLAIVGYGPCVPELKAQATSLELDHAIRWLGPLRREELAPLYASADVFVSPSIRTAGGWEEALGLVFLEAMASGTVPVGSRTGGIADVIRHGENGVLAGEKDPVDLANQINWVLETTVCHSSKNPRLRG
jgi:glycosyltransferase involved in cell wall biosynthesis